MSGQDFETAPFNHSGTLPIAGHIKLNYRAIAYVGQISLARGGSR